jgi:hypothetical protein
MATGATPLANYPGDVVELACSKCERRGHYRKVSLVAIHGATIGLPDLRVRIAADCPRMRDPIGNDPCGVHFPALATPR